MSNRHPYQDIEAVVTTKHFKTPLFENEYSRALNWKLQTADLDTDALGTFSGEIERTGSPLETAVKKARMGIEETGIPFGLASEGSVSNDPFVQLLISDIETVVFVDNARDLVISESYRSFEIVALQKEVDTNTDLGEFLMRVDFPNHALIAKIKSPNGKVTAIKGITDDAHLRRAITELAEKSPNKKVTLEPDLRAHFSPTRQVNIKNAAELLLKRISQLCPSCQTPGFGKITYEKGLNCSDCGTLNPEAIKSEVLNCISCPYAEAGKLLAANLEPRFCPVCNP